MKSRNTPSRWPPNITYLYSPSYASSLPQALIMEIRGSEPSLRSPPSPRVSIRCITAKDHPATGQYGLFSAQTIPPNSHICYYFGEVHCEDRDSDYDLSLLRSPDGISVGIDASKMGNEGRFVNDYRGIEAKPNSLFKEERTASGELRIGICCGSSKIQKGREILVSYGKYWWKARIASSGTLLDSNGKVDDTLSVQATTRNRTV